MSQAGADEAGRRLLPTALGFLTPPAPSPATESWTGRLTFLPDLGAIVAVERWDPSLARWRCMVLASRTPVQRRIAVATDVLTCGETSLMVEPEADAELAVMVWLTRVWQRWRGGPVTSLAELLAARARAGSSMAIESAPTVLRELAVRGRLRPSGVERVLDRLTCAGFLRREPDGSPLGHFHLTIPEPQYVPFGSGLRENIHGLG
jgi:hypothetical protein